MRREKNVLRDRLLVDFINALMGQEDAVFVKGPDVVFQPVVTHTMHYLKSIPLMRQVRAKRAKRRRGVYNAAQ